jgi:hypothetical protein
MGERFSKLKLAAGCSVAAVVYLVIFGVGLLILAAVVVWAYRTLFGP